MGLVAMVTYHRDCVIVVAMVTHCRHCVVQFLQSPTLVAVSNILFHCVNLSEKMEGFVGSLQLSMFKLAVSSPEGPDHGQPV